MPFQGTEWGEANLTLMPRSFEWVTSIALFAFHCKKKAITVAIIACHDSWPRQTHLCALPQLYQAFHCWDRLRARGLLNVKAGRASWNTTPTYQQDETRTWMPNLTGSLANTSEIFCITTTWNHQIWGFDDNVSIHLRIFHSLFLKSLAPIHF